MKRSKRFVASLGVAAILIAVGVSPSNAASHAVVKTKPSIVSQVASFVVKEIQSVAQSVSTNAAPMARSSLQVGADVVKFIPVAIGAFLACGPFGARC